jgi:hypothetical protein
VTFHPTISMSLSCKSSVSPSVVSKSSSGTFATSRYLSRLSLAPPTFGKLVSPTYYYTGLQPMTYNFGQTYIILHTILAVKGPWCDFFRENQNFEHSCLRREFQPISQKIPEDP